MNSGFDASGISTMTEFAGKLVVGGKFYSPDAPLLKHIALWDGQGWSAIAGGVGAPTDSVVMVADLNGELLALGSMGAYRLTGLPGNWVRFDAFGGGIQRATANSGQLYVVAQGSVWHWNGTNWSYRANIPGTCSTISSLGADVYLGGEFSVAGEECFLLRLSGTQLTQVPTMSLRRKPSVMAVDGAGLVIGCDDFIPLFYCDGQSVNYHTRYSISGHNLAPCYLPERYDRVIRSMVIWDNSLVVAGNFFEAGGRPASNLTEFTSSGAIPLASRRGLVRSGDFLGAGIGGAVVISPSLVPGCSAGGWRYYDLFGWNGYDWENVGRYSGPYAQVKFSTVIDDELYIVGNGSFSGPPLIEGFPQGAINWTSSYWAPGPPLYGDDFASQMRVLAKFGGAFVAGGQVPPLGGGDDQTQVAVLDAGAWIPLGGSFSSLPPASAPSVNALTQFGTGLVAGGEFESAGTVLANGVAHWDGMNWLSMGMGFNGPVTQLASFGNVLVAAGRFTMSGSIAVNGLAEWSGTDWIDIGTGIVQTGETPRLQVIDGCILATGYSLFGRPASLLKWSGAGWIEFIPDCEGVFGKFDSDYYFSRGSLLPGQDFGPARWISTGVGAVDDSARPEPPEAFSVALEENPTRGPLRISLHGLGEAAAAVLDIFDVTGRRVIAGKPIVDSQGKVIVSLDELARPGDRLKDGIYWLRVSAGQKSVSKKFVVLR